MLFFSSTLSLVASAKPSPGCTAEFLRNFTSGGKSACLTINKIVTQSGFGSTALKASCRIAIAYACICKCYHCLVEYRFFLYVRID